MAQMEKEPEESTWLRSVLRAYKTVLVKAQNKHRKSNAHQHVNGFVAHLKKSRDENWTAISFNQDTVLEYATQRLYPRWDLPAGGWGLIFSSRKRNDIFKPLRPPRILKPHGCIAWTRDHDKHLIGSTNIDRRTLESHCQPDNNDSKKIPLILAPSYLKQYDDLTIWHTMARVCHELIHANHIRVIGFRLRPDDTLASHVIRMALRLNQQKRSRTKPLVFELVDPNAASNAEGSMGRTWSGVATMLAAKGWTIRRHPVSFKDYVKNCLKKCTPRCEQATP